MSGVCALHGPYDGPACPYPPPHTDYSGGRPARPNPLADDDVATEFSGRDDNEATGPTAVGGGRREDGEAETEIRGRRRGADLDIEEDEPTMIDKGADVDVTVPPLDRAPRPTLALLWVKEGARPGKIYPLRDGTVIGRQWERDGDLVLDERGVSSRHAKFRLEKGEFSVWDLGSTYGTFVNGRQIREATLLQENDLVKIGETVFLVKLLEPKTRRAASSKRAAKKGAPRKARK